jgi:hypothetical protein
VDVAECEAKATAVLVREMSAEGQEERMAASRFLQWGQGSPDASPVEPINRDNLIKKSRITMAGTKKIKRSI